MQWWLHGWNERSFEGWAAWWGRIAAITVAFLFLESVFLSAASVPSLLDVVRMTLVVAGLLGLVARFTQWYARMPFLAALGGWSRLLWGLPLLPLVDGVLARVWPEAVSGAFWVAPEWVWSWALVGWNGEGFASFGMTLAVLGCAFLAWQRFEGLWWRRFGGAFVIAAVPWMVFAVPSMAAWTKLSSYGTTFASGPGVVERAFERAFERSAWSMGEERFLGVDTALGNVSADLALAGLAWLFAFAALAPARTARRQEARERAESLVPWLGAMFGGVAFAMERVAGQAWIGWGVGSLCLFGVLVLGARLAQDTLADTEQEHRVTEALLFASGLLLFGWPALFAGALLVSSLLFIRQSVGAVRMIAMGGFVSVCLVFGSALAQHSTGFVGWNAPLVIGIALVAAALHQITGPREAVRLFGRVYSEAQVERGLWLAWWVGLLLLWWGVGIAAFAPVVAVLALLFPVGGRLFSLTQRQALWLNGALPLLLGLLLRPGLFLP